MWPQERAELNKEKYRIFDYKTIATTRPKYPFRFATSFNIRQENMYCFIGIKVQKVLTEVHFIQK